MSGPLPPAVGGMASVLGALGGSSLASRVDLRLFETGKTTPAGRSLWQGIKARLALMWQWRRQFAGQPTPIAHIHTCSGLTFFLDGLLLLLCQSRGAPVVLHIHGARFDEFLDGLSRPLAGMARWLGRKAAVVIVLSPEWEERIARRWPGAHIHVVANGVAANTMAYAVDSTEQAPHFVFLGNLGRRKGVPQIIEAAAQARVPWTLALAGGEEDDGALQHSRDEIAARGLEQRLSVLGPVVGEAKFRLLAQAQGFVLPSLAEGLPMAMLEAMAVGLPPVVTAVGAMPEVVRHGQDGIVVPAADAAALAAALDELAIDAPRRAELGRSAAARCAELYGIERMATAIHEIYLSLSTESR